MIENQEELNINFGDKFTSTDFEYFIANYFSICFKYPRIKFNLQQIEWISLEEITFLFAWIRYIKLAHPNLKSIKVNLPKLTPQEDNDSFRRKKQRLLNLWNVWKIWKKCELNLSTETNITDEINKYVDEYQNDTHWHHIVPFTHLNSENIKDFNDIREKVEKNIYNRFDLTNQVEQILERFSSFTPFENKALSGIITTELYLNSILHAYNNEEKYNECYFAVAFRNKINIQDYKQKKEEHGEFLTEEQVNNRVDYILEQNLKERNIDEHSFFADLNKKNISLNESYLEFTFMDFGNGIPNKLFEQYQKADINDIHLSEKHYERKSDGDFLINRDSRVLEYAFQLDSSSNPFDQRLEINDYIPRGLFFLVDIVRRYNGLLVVRSGTGKIIFNFKNTKKISESVHFSEKDSKLAFFNGTLFSIYLPAKSEKELLFNKLEINLEDNNKTENKDNKSIIEYININEIVKINRALENGNGLINIYNRTFQRLNDKVDSFKYKCTVYVDFSGTEDIEVINRKLYFYLCYTPRFNSNSKIIIVHPSNIGELYQAKQAIRYSKLPIFRPIPCFLSDDKKKIQIVWLGITEKQDEELLNSSILSHKSKNYNIDKFINKESLIGNVISIDESDFVKIDIENISNILEYYSSDFIYNEIPKRFLSNYLTKSKTVSNQPEIIQEDDSFIYWTSGGYYQVKFISLIDLLYSYETIKIGNRGETADERFGERVARYLIEKYNFNNGKPLEIDYIVTVTLSSQLLGKHIKDMYHRLIYNETGDKKTPELIRLANYHEFSLEKAFRRIKEGKKILIVNDVISTGKLSNELYQKLHELKKAEIVSIFTLIDSREEQFKDVQHIYNEDVDNITCKLIDFPIEKFKNKNDIIDSENKQVISIDPVINSPSMMKLERSMGENILYFENKEHNNEEFLNVFIEPEHLWVGHFHHNVTHHSYYFKTHEIILSNNGEKLLKELFDFIIEREFAKNEINYVFHPMFSAIEALTNNKIKNILANYPNLYVFPLPRIDTPKGWRFTFPPKLLNAKGWNFTKRNVVIIDDGSCSGDTMLQMIDSVAMIEVEKIVVISIIARLEDFQREFYSRLKSIKGFQKYIRHIVQKTDTWESLSKKYNISKQELLKNNKPVLIPDEIIGIPQVENNIKEIPITIYFGTHFHIPVYSPLKHCPFCYETTIINDELNSKVPPPDSVKRYLNKRINEISLCDTDGSPLESENILCNGTPSYFPKSINFKKLFLARDVIGKIDTYRLYRDYIKDNYDKIEIDYYLAVVLHETRLIDSISHLLPHLKVKLKCAIKNEIGLKSSDSATLLSLKWDSTQIIKALYILDNELFFDLPIVKKVAEYVEINNSDTIHYFIYCYWKIIKEKSRQNTIIPLIFQLWDDLKANSKLKKAWGNFCVWITNHKIHSFSEGNSFQYLRDFYIVKKNEYPNHLTIGNEFIKLKTSVLSLKQILETEIFKFDLTADYKKLFAFYKQAREKLEHPFLTILQREDFIEIIRLCGMYDLFYSEENSISLILNRIENDLIAESNLKNIENLIQELNHFIDFYLNDKSVFGKFFLNHESNLNVIISEVHNSFLFELNSNEITPSLTLPNNNSNFYASIHPQCFTLIIDEFLKNSIKHTKRIKDELGVNNLKNNIIEIGFEPYKDKIKLYSKHHVNIPQSNEKELQLGGLDNIQKIINFFNGTFSIDDNPEYFLVEILISKAFRDYNI